jgi:hypothetical protein
MAEVYVCANSAFEAPQVPVHRQHRNDGNHGAAREEFRTFFRAMDLLGEEQRVLRQAEQFYCEPRNGDHENT